MLTAIHQRAPRNQYINITEEQLWNNKGIYRLATKCL